MSYRRADVVEHAIVVLDAYGLADLSMRRLASELGVQPSALYHHFANKQTLLAAVADEILHRGTRPRTTTAWDDRVVEVCGQLRDAMLAYRDGAELVATVSAFGLGAEAPALELAEALADADLDADLAPVAARTLIHFVLGHVMDEQTQMQASSAGAIEDRPREESDFALGLALVLDGIRVRAAVSS
ncbi:MULTISPECIES: TetR/AcrR family transcriptional regulator C-terminal domain-containing protein [unclassified Nocardioides]|uniref:TetR/AcrR family transcriptional regulator C-terminal domain-containing protein n=1 Tax=unclassified Nocardioides TaxID=2615069 RepID=UPI0006F2AD3A|nr:MULTISPECIES: TetR/AcrR family transcriptional regulator C-terminal domain-containing protein [unclassified Nocardioides]KQY63756.1 TetR family transcriptional regulator [Nocardioides sp. Root140]KQZ69681.1 TetR family transcriptional regulator [Nocardioides sp. Root151]KRF15772.1 TetR family transcriptional regulator [Nocardioides sp. Soil796]